MKIRLPSASAKDQVSISSTFYDQRFCTKVFFCRFSLATVWLCNFIGTRISAAHKILMKLSMVSISFKFYKLLFGKEAFLNLQFVFVILLERNFGAKAACKILGKLTTSCQFHQHFTCNFFVQKHFFFSYKAKT